MKDSFVVIKLGGVQHIVSQGDQITVNRIKGSVGDEFDITDVYLYQDDKETIVGTPDTGYIVVAEIIEHLKGAKIDVRTYKAKARTRRHVGHRQLLTKVSIKSISKTKTASKVAEKAPVVKKDTKPKATVKTTKSTEVTEKKSTTSAKKTVKKTATKATKESSTKKAEVAKDSKK